MKAYGCFDGSGCGVYRVQLPLTTLKIMAGYEVQLGDKVLPPPDGDRQYDLICMNRQRVEPSGENAGKPGWWFAQWQARGTVISADLDDDIWHLDETNPAVGRIDEEQLAGEAKTLQMADMVTVTTETLAKIARKLNPNVTVINNHVPGALLSAKRTANVENPNLIVGWAGGMSHYKDLQVIGPVLQRYKHEFPDVDLHTVGLNFGKLLDIPARHTLWDPDIWGYYRNLDFDIGLAPLAYTKFNRSKSALKAIEYMALGIPVIATDIEPYREIIEHGVTGFLCKERRHWMSALRRLTTDEELRRKMSVEARKAAKQYTFEAGWHKWDNAYQEAIRLRKHRQMQTASGVSDGLAR